MTLELRYKIFFYWILQYNCLNILITYPRTMVIIKLNALIAFLAMLGSQRNDKLANLAKHLLIETGKIKILCSDFR